jgi:hypothetical protein
VIADAAGDDAAAREREVDTVERLPVGYGELAATFEGSRLSELQCHESKPADTDSV